MIYFTEDNRTQRCLQDKIPCLDKQAQLLSSLCDKTRSPLSGLAKAGKGWPVIMYNPSHPEEQLEGCAGHAEFAGTSCRIQVMEREHGAEPSEPDSA